MNIHCEIASGITTNTLNSKTGGSTWEKEKKKKKEEAEEEDIVVPVKSSGVAGKVIGSICLVGGIALVVVAALMIVGII
mgnify:CR=1 FL=1